MPRDELDGALVRSPFIAILRGVRPDEVEDIAEGLNEAGVAMIEVPLNSPDPIRSITRLAERFGDRALVGAGTVLSADQVMEVADVGGRLIVSPNTAPRVIDAAAKRGLIALPGCLTPSEAFAAIDAGAAGLKFFPADAIAPTVLKALDAVLPRGSLKLVVGGVSPATLHQWSEAGAVGFGLGTGIYRPGYARPDVLDRLACYQRAFHSPAAPAR